jgi:hypothetical protein
MESFGVRMEEKEEKEECEEDEEWEAICVSGFLFSS